MLLKSKKNLSNPQQGIVYKRQRPLEMAMQFGRINHLTALTGHKSLWWIKLIESSTVVKNG